MAQNARGAFEHNCDARIIQQYRRLQQLRRFSLSFMIFWRYLHRFQAVAFESPQLQWRIFDMKSRE